MVKVLSKEFLPDEEKFLNIEKFAPDLDQKKLSKFIQIISSNTLVVNKFEWYFSQYNLSMGRFHMLIDLYFTFGGCEGEGVSPAQLAERFSVKSATISGMLSTLEKDGFIDRKHCCEDRRRVKVVLTKKGETVFLEFFPKHLNNVAILLEKLDMNELMDLETRLDRLRTCMDEFAVDIFGDGKGKTDK